VVSSIPAAFENRATRRPYWRAELRKLIVGRTWQPPSALSAGSLALAFLSLPSRDPSLVPIGVRRGGLHQARISPSNFRPSLISPSCRETAARCVRSAERVANALPERYPKRKCLLGKLVLCFAKWLFKVPPFDLLKDFTPLGRVVSIRWCFSRIRRQQRTSSLVAHSDGNPASSRPEFPGPSHPDLDMLNAAA